MPALRREHLTHRRLPPRGFLARGWIVSKKAHRILELCPLMPALASGLFPFFEDNRTVNCPRFSPHELNNWSDLPLLRQVTVHTVTSNDVLWAATAPSLFAGVSLSRKPSLSH